VAATADPIAPFPTTARAAVRRRRGWGTVAKTTASALITLVFFFPILWWVSASIRPYQSILSVPPDLTFTPTLDWFKVVLGNVDPSSLRVAQEGAVGQAASGGGIFYSVPYLLDSLIIGVGSTALVLLVATPAAYALSRFRIRRRRDLNFWILSQRMLPPIVAAYPLSYLLGRLGLVDTHLGLILVHAAINAPLGVLLLMSFFDEVPRELDDAALVDGASRLTAFRQVVLRYVGGGLAATAVLVFIFSWNEFLLALTLTTGGVRTIPVAASTFETNYSTEWGYLAALGTSAMVPVFLFILLVQRHLVRGLTLGAVK